MLVAQNIIKSYGDLKVLKGVGLEIGHGEVVSIVGSSGAGKSSLLHILGTLDVPDSGEIIFDGVAGLVAIFALSESILIGTIPSALCNDTHNILSLWLRQASTGFSWYEAIGLSFS